jgi:peptidoglycan/xylan/chitin deacetylase (PgdA/CDA1 family)
VARLIGPDESGRLVYRSDGTARSQGLVATVYSDAGGTVLANILTEAGAAISGSALTIDAYSKIPLFQFPDGVDTVYVTVAGGPLVPLYARTDDRLDALATAVTAAQATATAAIPLTQRAAASGVATLDVSVNLPADQQTAGWDASPRMPQWVQPSTIISTLQSGHGWTNNAGSTLSTDTSDYVLGTQSVVITTGGAGAQANLSKTGMASMDATNKVVRLRFKIADLTNVQEIGFFLGSSSFANFYKWSIWTSGSSRFAQSGEWATITLSWADATTGGSPVRSALTDGRFYIIDNNTGAQVVAKWQSCELVPDGSSTWPTGVISICFDDTYAAQWTLAKPILDTYGYPATAFTIGEYVDSAVSPGRLTLAQLKAMQVHSGWEIAAHANTGTNHSASYTGLTAAQLESDIRNQHMWLNAKGFRGADGTAFPLGQFGSTSDGASTTDIVRAHWGYARTTSSRMKETFPPADRWRLRAISGISTFSGGYAPSSLTTAVTGDIAKCATYKTWLILVFHNIVTTTPASTSECLQSDLSSIVAAINAAGIPVRTIADVLRTGGS